MLDYLIKAASAWLMGFAPMLEIYVAIPAALAMGLDAISATIWPAFGNFVVVPFLLVFYQQMLRVPRFGPWLERRSQGRGSNLMKRYGIWIVLVGTPWISVWVVAPTAIVLGMRRSILLLASLVSIVTYAVLLVVLIQTGVDFIG